MKIIRYSLAIAVYLAAYSNGYAIVVEDCDQGVDFYNGNTTKGKSGDIVCRDRETKQITRKVTLKNGETVKEAIYRNGIKAMEESRKDGKKQGLAQYFYDDGKLKESGNYENDSPVGTNTRYFPNGAVQYLDYHVKGSSQAEASVELNLSGKPMLVSCTDKYPAEFAKYCKGQVQLYDTQNNKTKMYAGSGADGVVKSENGMGGVDNEISYDNGKRNGPAKFYDEKGNVTRIDNYINGKKAGAQKVYFPNSSQVSEITTYDDKGEKEVKFEEFYQNGSPKTYQEDLADWKYIEKGYYDNGNLCCEFTYQEAEKCGYDDWFCGGKIIGDAKHYDKEGWLKEVDSYDADGNISKSVTYKSKDVTPVTKYYFPDGSEKR